MATTAICNTFKSEILKAGHNLDAAGNTVKSILIKVGPTRTFDGTQTNVGTPGTSAPSTSNVGTDEASGTGYTSGGNSLTNSGVTLQSTTGCADFASYSLTSATISVTAAVLGNNTQAGKAISVHDFGGTQTVTAGTLTITFPAAGAGTSTIRIA